MYRRGIANTAISITAGFARRGIYNTISSYGTHIGTRIINKTHEHVNRLIDILRTKSNEYADHFQKKLDPTGEVHENIQKIAKSKNIKLENIEDEIEVLHEAFPESDSKEARKILKESTIDITKKTINDLLGSL